MKKVAERSRDSGRRSRDRRLTVKQRFWTFQAIRKLFVKSHRRVTRQWSVVTRLSADCQAHICMYIIINERERERPNTKIRQKKLPRQFSRLLTPVPSLSFFSRESRARDMWCLFAYVYNGRERERERDREREGERETERVPCRIILFTMR